MTHTKHILLLLALVSLTYTALAQTGSGPASGTIAGAGDEILAARSQYAQVADGPLDDKTLAQFSRRGLRPPFPPHRGYPRRESYEAPWMNQGSAGHAVIGAAIGFGIGAAIGAIGGAHNGKSVENGILGGAIFALIGGMIGASHGQPHPFAHRRRVYPSSLPDDEEADRSADSQGLQALAVP